MSRLVEAGREAASAASLGTWAATGTRIAVVFVSVTAAVGCGDVNMAFEQLAQARQLSADISVQFTKAADAANRAVMSDRDDSSAAFAREAEQAKQTVQKDVDALGPILQRLGYADESRLLQEFVGRFAEYSRLDRQILDLAVENTNVKARTLAFGPAQEAADAFRASLESVAPKDTPRAEALVSSAVLAVREIQVLQPPHIADADDAAMTRMETRMATSEASARRALATLAPLVQPASRSRLEAATAALDRFMGIHKEIVALSRRNTNVRSLALSLEQKRALITPCEESLQALQDALATRRHVGRRWP